MIVVGTEAYDCRQIIALALTMQSASHPNDQTDEFGAMDIGKELPAYVRRTPTDIYIRSKR